MGTKNDKFGVMKTPNPGRDIYQTVDGIRFARYPVKTPLVKINDDLDDFIRAYALPFYKEDDIFCIASKVVSICRGYYVKESDLKIGWPAKFLVRFVKKWPHDPGFALPQKIQLAINMVGWPRFIIAMLGGGIMKILGKPGWFYILAGKNIGAIDGFVPEMYPEPLRGYGFFAPPNSDQIADEIEGKYGMLTALLDGNNVENTVLGMSKGLKKLYSKKKLMSILDGNPQGQSDGTPILIVRREE